MIKIALVAGEEVVDAQDLVTAVEQAVDQVRAEEAGATGHEDALAPEGSAGHIFSYFYGVEWKRSRCRESQGARRLHRTR